MDVLSSPAAEGQTAELLAELPAEHSDGASCVTNINGYKNSANHLQNGWMFFGLIANSEVRTRIQRWSGETDNFNSSRKFKRSTSCIILSALCIFNNCT